MSDNTETLISHKRPEARLTVKKGPQAGIIFPITQNRVVLGREEGCEIVLRDAEVSRRHVELRWEDGLFMVQDLGSTNGCFLNGETLSMPKAINAGDSLALGQTVLHFDSDAPSPNPSESGAKTSAQPKAAPKSTATPSDTPSQNSTKSIFSGQAPLYIGLGCGVMLLCCTCASLGILATDLTGAVDILPFLPPVN
jgi:pSer/pThr/pTyr-binding forkhead associated (FHA) protein